MDSVEFLLNEDFWSLLIDKSLYQNEMIEKKISDFIRGLFVINNDNFLSFAD